MIRGRMLVMGAAMLLFATACATMKDTPSRFTTVTLEKPVHFSAPDGADVLAASGRYQVDSIEDAKLRLIPVDAASGQPLTVAAMALPHEQPLESHVALSVPSGEDEHHVVLLLPGGKALDAAGTYSGIRPRGGSLAPLSMVQLQAAFVQQSLVVLDPRTLPIRRWPSDFDLAYAYTPIHYQDTDSTNHRADYVTHFDYDENTIATDNWENLTKFPLAAYAYYSVVETCTHWFIAYGFFQRDRGSGLVS